MPVSPFKLALVFGVFLALWHACWSALVYFGLAQALIDFVFWMHFIIPPYHVEAFEPRRAFVLVGVTFLIGLAAGAVIGIIWNLFHRAAAD